MNEEQTNEVLELIRLIDKRKSELFRTFDWLRDSLVYSALFIVLVIAYFGILAFVMSFLIFEETSTIDKYVVLLSFVAFVIGFNSFLAEVNKVDRVGVNYRKLEKYVKKDQKPLLKALIKIKAKNQEFDLEEIYNSNKPMFSPEKLMEKL
jgi:hypothetical protein